MKKFFEEFKAFALKGNVMSMAVGVLIGGAFQSIVTALTTDFINPLIASFGGAEIAGMIRLPWVDYTGLDTEAVTALALNYGHFITTVINFFIMALILFLMVKGMNKLMEIGKKKEEPKPAEPPKPTKEEELLTEIRDLLKSGAAEKSAKNK